MRTIDGDALKEIMCMDCDNRHLCTESLGCDTVQQIDSMPTIETEPIKHGRWIYEQLPLSLSDGSKECVRCSVCNTHWDNESKYCPNCGARMDLDEVKE